MLEVRAVAADDGLEVTFVAPASASRGDIERLAVSKLAYVRRRQSESGDGRPPRPGKGGLTA
jgi:hypothetical protein